jgi:hypothetical protein
MLLVAVCALGIVGYRGWDEGLDFHWALLKLRFGDAATCRATIGELQRAAPGWSLNLTAAGRSASEQQRAMMQAVRRSARLVPTLVQVARRPQLRDEPGTYYLLSCLLSWYGTPRSAAQARSLFLESTCYSNPSIRRIAIDTLPNLVGSGFDEDDLLSASTAALSDPNSGVRGRALNNILTIALSVTRGARADIRASLMSMAQQHPAPDVRIGALSAVVAIDRKNSAGDGDPKVLSIVLKALDDPYSRSWAVTHLAMEYRDHNGRLRVLWSDRNSEINVHLRGSLSDEQEGLRAYAALGLVRRGVHDHLVWTELDKATRYNDIDAHFEFSAARDLCSAMQYASIGLRLP